MYRLPSLPLNILPLTYSTLLIRCVNDTLILYDMIKGLQTTHRLKHGTQHGQLLQSGHDIYLGKGKTLSWVDIGNDKCEPIMQYKHASADATFMWAVPPTSNPNQYILIIREQHSQESELLVLDRRGERMQQHSGMRGAIVDHCWNESEQAELNILCRGEEG